MVYRPGTERRSHYFDAVLPEQFEASVWFAETTAVTPLAEAGRAQTTALPIGTPSAVLASGLSSA